MPQGMANPSDAQNSRKLNTFFKVKCALNFPGKTNFLIFLSWWIYNCNLWKFLQYEINDILWQITVKELILTRREYVFFIVEVSSSMADVCQLRFIRFKSKSPAFKLQWILHFLKKKISKACNTIFEMYLMLKKIAIS